MPVIWAICRRDLIQHFTTPLAWLVLAAWTFVINLLFWITIADTHGAAPNELPSVPLVYLSLAWGSRVLVLLAPAITMNSFASERVQGTMQLLLTAPITELQLLIGKFLGNFLMLLTLIAASAVQVLWFISEPGGTQLIAGYCSLILAALLFAAIGTWISLLVDSPVAAYVLTMSAILALFLVSLFADRGLVQWDWLNTIGAFFGLDARLQPLREGQFRVADVSWFLALSASCLLLAHSALCARRVHG